MPQPTDEAQAPLYEDGVGIANEYEVRPGVAVLPIAQDPPASSQGFLAAWSPVVVLRLHAPYRVRRVRYGAKKTNNPPVMPSPSDVGAFVFCGGSVGITTAMNASLTNFDWLVSTDYVFVEKVAHRVADGFVLGTPPWRWQVAVDNYGDQGPVPAGGIGAVATAGKDARFGYKQGVESAAKSEGGVFWGYNTPSFYPGSFLSTDLVNAGPVTAKG